MRSGEGHDDIAGVGTIDGSGEEERKSGGVVISDSMCSPIAAGERVGIARWTRHGTRDNAGSNVKPSKWRYPSALQARRS